MNNSDVKDIICVVVFVFCAFMLLALLTGCRIIGRAVSNEIDYVEQKVDDATNYDTRKEVEDTCRAMVVSYNSDKMTWETYKDSDSEEKQSWAEQAKIRANKTAASYNEYVLKNSFVFDGNIPDDIEDELEYIR